MSRPADPAGPAGQAGRADSAGDARPIGVFDSGIGGLTVMRAVASRLPEERLIYLGDTARVPYGTKSAATVSRYSRQCAGFLRQRGIKALVVACNTASALAMDDLRALMAPHAIPVLGVIEPGAVEACRVSRFGRVGVIGTASTIRSDAYARAIGAIKPDFTVFSAACPLFVPLAEEGWNDADDPVARTVAMRYLEPLRIAGVDTVILGCTHYPLLRGVIEGVLPGVALVDSGAAVTADLARALARLGIASRVGAAGSGAYTPGGAEARPDTAPAATRRAEYYVTDDPERFRTVGVRFLGHDIEGPHLAELTRDDTTASGESADRGERVDRG